MKVVPLNRLKKGEIHCIPPPNEHKLYYNNFDWRMYDIDIYIHSNMRSRCISTFWASCIDMHSYFFLPPPFKVSYLKCT